MNVTVENVSDHVIDVAATRIIFTEGNRSVAKFDVNCNTQILAGERRDISVPFKVGSWANTGINVFDVHVEYGEAGPRYYAGTHIKRGAGRINVAESEPNGKRVFVSHSNSSIDNSLVRRIRAKLSALGFDPYIAEHDPKEGDNLWTKILQGMESSQLAVVLWTKHGAKSCDVREEIGMAVALQKRLVPLAEAELAGSLTGLEYVPLDRGALEKSTAGVAERVVSLLAQ